MRAPEGIEISGHDHRFVRLHDQIVQRAQLVLPMPELQRQVHEEDADILQLQLDDQALDAGVKIMEALTVHMRSRQKGVALLAHDGHQVVQRTGAVFALKCGVVAQLPGYVLGLVDHAGADRAGVHLDQANDVGLLGTDEIGDRRQHLAIAAQVTGARNGQVEGRTGAGGVANVVDK